MVGERISRGQCGGWMIFLSHSCSDLFVAAALLSAPPNEEEEGSMTTDYTLLNNIKLHVIIHCDNVMYYYGIV